MSDKIIIFCDINDSVSTLREQYHACQLFKSNLKYANTLENNYCVSLGDIDLIQAIDLVKDTSRIIIQPNKQWSSIELLKTTVYFCKYLSHVMPVENLEFYSYLDFNYQDYKDEVSYTNKKLYLFGGSTVAGVGLINKDERFGKLLSSKLKLDLIDHSRPGAGLRRSFEQLLTCNPSSQDIIILDATSPDRLRLNNNKIINDVSLKDCSKHMVVSTTDDQLFYNQISYLNAFVKICNLLKVRMIFYNSQPEEPLLADYLLCYSKYPNWCLKTSIQINNPIDLGLDNIHPGPKTHAKMAEVLSEQLNRSL